MLINPNKFLATTALLKEVDLDFLTNYLALSLLFQVHILSELIILTIYPLIQQLFYATHIAFWIRSVNE